jgi:hypothetical protein
VDGETFLRRYIENRLVDLGLRRGRQPNDPQEVHIAISNAAAAAEALVSVDAIEREAAERMLDDLREFLVDENKLEPNAFVAGPLGSDTETGPYSWGDIADRRAPPQLVRVIPLGREAGLIGEARVTVLSIELWSDHFTIRYAISAEGSMDTPGPLWTWRVHDDTGALYRRGGGLAGGGGGRLWLGQDEFHPVPGPDANFLTLVARKIGPVEVPDPQRMVPVDGVAMEELFRIDVPLN